MKKGTHEKSISELEGWTWTDPIPSADDSSGTVLRFYRLHRTPIKDLDLGDLRFLIGQNAALEHLVPMALDQLRKNLFVETDYYPGDLLQALFSINDEPSYWTAHPDHRQILIRLYEDNMRQTPTVEMSSGDLKKIEREYEKFKAQLV
ncbi:MAG: hypothetical protein IPJ85_15060 [Flavobacteriales bacterium]|nr:hypothetical protein [Flavobacteriales bacterium]